MRPNICQKADTRLQKMMLCMARTLFGAGLFSMMRPIPVTTKTFSLTVLAALVMLCGVSPAAAESVAPSDTPLVLASLNTHVPSSRTSQPRLFGASEQRYSDISAFTKWTGVQARFKEEFQQSLNKPHVRRWMTFLASLKDKSKAEQIEAVNTYMNRMRFVSDEKNYDMNDYWATPMEFLKRGGDCEDYAFAKYVSLRALGFSQDDLRMAIVYDNEMRMPHAVLVVYHDDDAKILDNQSPDVRVSAEVQDRYKPIYSISQVAWYRH